MKKCPKCKAEIQEEARFCLYCMTSFEEKQTIETPKRNNKWRLYRIAAVLVLLLVALIGIFFLSRDTESNKPEDAPSHSSTGSTLNSSGGNNSTTSGEQQADGVEEGESSVTTGDNQTQTTSTTDKPSVTTTTDSKPTSIGLQNGTTTKQTTAKSSERTTTHTTTASVSSQSSTTTRKTPTNSVSSGVATTEPVPTTTITTKMTTSRVTSNVTSSVPTVTQPPYNYVEATIANAYPTEYGSYVLRAPEDAIVITKVNYKEESGNYVIPDTIDGKKVAAIMPSAFSDPAISSSVKSVTLPSKVRTIWHNAFENCFNLTDLYLKTETVGIYEDAFPAASKRNGQLTIHCKRDCRNFDYYYYRNIADDYNAVYAEWNG